MKKYFTPSLGVLCVGLLVTFGHHGNYWSAHWASKWAILILLFSLAVGVCVSKKSLILGITVGYLLLNAAAICVWPQNQYVGVVDTLTLIALEKNSLYAYVVVLLMAIVFLNFKSTHKRGAITVLAVIPLVSLLTTLTTWRQSATDGFYSGNPSMNGCLIAALLPFLFFNYYVGMISLSLAVTAIFLIQKSVPYGVLAVSLGAYLLAYYKPSHRTYGKIALLLIGVVLAKYTLLHKGFFEDSGRFDVWKEIIAYWQAHGSLLFGTGLGSIQMLAPSIQSANHPDQPLQLFLWLHNDWLQILIEAGWVGFLCVACSWWVLLKRSFRSPALFSSFCAFSAMALFNYPLRLPIHSFCLLLICCLIWHESQPFDHLESRV